MSSNYKKVSKLGSGAFATTFIVEELGKPSSSTNESVKKLVMKRCPCKHMRAANAALQEVKVLLSCHHDGIVGYHDFFLDTDGDENIVICLVMEFCDGGDLWEKIAAARRSHTKLNPSDIAGWTIQLVAALRYLHDRSILHRDIKPENVFLTDEGEHKGAVAKLGDFGLATATEQLESSAKTQVGTPDYMAPEVLEGRPYSAPADIFSLGATVYAMVCASFPKVLAMHLGQGKALDWTAASEAMSDWRDLISRMLQITEQDRPNIDDVGLLAAALPASKNLIGTSATAKASLYLPPTGNGGEGSRETSNSAANASPAGQRPPSAPPLPAIPSRPSQPMATEVKHNQLVLLWETPPNTDEIDTYQVLAQISGTGGFGPFLSDTSSSHPIVRLDSLSAGTWYEFKVVAVNAAGSSAASAASLPVQTGEAPASAATLAARNAAAAQAAALSAELRERSPRLSERESRLIAVTDPELLSRYAQCKRELVAWESRFERSSGRPATDQDKVSDLAYQGLIARYKKLKHAKRKLTRQHEGPPATENSFSSRHSAAIVISPRPSDYTGLAGNGAPGSSQASSADVSSAASSNVPTPNDRRSNGRAFMMESASGSAGNVPGHASATGTRRGSNGGAAPPVKATPRAGETQSSATASASATPTKSSRSSKKSSRSSGKHKSSKHGKSRREPSRPATPSSVPTEAPRLLAGEVKPAHAAPGVLGWEEESFE